MVDSLVDGHTKKSMQLTDCSLITAISPEERARFRGAALAASRCPPGGVLANL